MLGSFSMLISSIGGMMFLMVCLVSYPHALHHLELLQHAQFRSEMKKDDYFREFLHQKQFDHWRTW